ncbi:MAG: hypothetical protein FIB08_00680 [Candidatus Methanoperedens sp.]|nr:hypothetical protein [Candidatus Methanoperedens sp.]
MDRQLNLKNIVLIGRTFEEYHKMFDLGSSSANEYILDVASGVSSFCAEASAKGYNVTASDQIYTSSPPEIEKKCRDDLGIVIKQLPALADLYVWNFFRDVHALKTHREKAYKSFIKDFKKYGTKRYIPAIYPSTDFKEEQFTISLVSHFLFLYEDHISYDFHRKVIRELLRITSKEIRIFPIVNLKGKKSLHIDRLMHDKEFNHLQISIKKVGYEFMKDGNEMMLIAKSGCN